MASENERDSSAFLASETLNLIRKLFSTILTLAALGLILYAIGKNHAALPGHPAVHYFLFAFVLVLLGYLEGLQIAILELEKVRLPQSEAFRRKYPRAIKSLQLATDNNGLNVQRFLIGRQFFVVFVVFLCAQLTTYPTLPKDGWPPWLFVIIIDTGLPGALVVLGFAQLMPQLVAATHPVAFMNLRGAWSVVKLALVLESIGIAHCAWVLASVVKSVFGYRGDTEKIAGIQHYSGHDEGHSNNGATAGNKVDDVYVSTDSLLEKRFEHHLFVSSKDARVSSGTYRAGELGKEVLKKKSNKKRERNLPPWLLPSSIQKFEEWGVNEESGAPFPSPKCIVDYLIQRDEPVPRYLLPPDHPKHIPPHVVAYDLIQRETNVLNEMHALLSKYNKAKLQLYELGADENAKTDLVKVAMSPNLNPMQPFLQSEILGSSGNNQLRKRSRLENGEYKPSDLPKLVLSRAKLAVVEKHRREYRKWRAGDTSGAKGSIIDNGH